MQITVVLVILLSALEATVNGDSAPLQCGIPHIRPNQLIVLGEDTSSGDWPWHVAIYHRKGRSVDYACGGTVINERFILTAAHCVMNQANSFQYAPNRIFIRVGIHDLEVVNPKVVQQHEVGRIHKFANFTQLVDDIALIELSTLIQFNEYVQPACINLETNITGETGTVVGWGITEDDEISPLLKKVDLPVVDPVTCLASNRVLFGQTLNQGMFCAGYTNGTSVCNGDSGGGLFFKRANSWFLGGIVSFSQMRSDGSNQCFTDGYGAFTKVHHYLAWISGITGMRFVRDNEVAVCKAVEPDPGKTYPVPFPRQCGIYIPNRIYGGNTTKVFEFPWMAALIYKDEKLYCSGSLINKRYVLTGANCIANLLPIKVRLGEHTFDQDVDCNEMNEDCAPPVRDYRIECIITHPSFSFQTYSNDIALIRLSENVMFEDHIQPICMPHTKQLKNFQPPRYIITGWGRTMLGRDSKALLKGTLGASNISKCVEYENLGINISDRQLCVGGDGVDTCGGDGGGPLGWGAQLYGVRFVQFGITSAGAKPCGRWPSIFTNVASYMDWIIANMKP